MRRDDYISAELRLFPMGENRLILTVDGSEGGWIELVLDVSDGAIQSMTLTSPLPDVGELQEAPEARTVSGKRPCLEIADLMATSGASNFDRWNELSAPLAEGFRGVDRVLRFARGTVTTIYEAGGLDFGVAADGTLLEVTIRSALVAASTGW